MRDFVLHGSAVVAADGVSKAPLSIRGGRIAPSAPRGARRLDLRDHLVFPGLVNAHDHLHVNCVPPLKGATHFPNSYEWIAAFQSHFDTLEVKAALRVPKSVRLKHGALKNLLAGTTFVVHHDPWHPALDEPRFPVSLLREFGWSYAVAGPSYGPDVRQSFADTPGDRPWMIHLAEGTDAVAAAELAQLDRMGCLRQNSVLIHGVGLRERDVARVIEAGAAVVWCPASNLALLGHTLDPRRLYAAGRLALGTDSRLSGARDLLEELRGALYRHGLNAAQLLGLVTADAAHVLRLSSHGHLAAGAEADLVIVADRGGEESRNLIGLGRGELRAVVRGGVPQVADPDFTPWFDACGVETVQVVLDGRPKLLARALADPEVIALEPGLELVAARAEPARRVAMAG
ncbi:MAG TPA: amidohydrolase family protein [Rhodanobacteraceae bacterium]|nr:amidohydrolase family protein [Rhodanobacteraceae bacterium]